MSSDTMRRDPTRGTLTTKQRKAVVALLSTGEVKAAAQEAGIHRDTLHRWLHDPLFLAAVREAEAEALDELSRMLVRLGRNAVATIAKAMGDAETPVAIRVRAADVALNRLLQLRELAQLEARVQALEQAAAAEGTER